MKLFKFNNNYKLVNASEAEMNLRLEPQIIRPADAKKVFPGKVFSVYSWKQKLFDGTTSTFETLTRPDSVNVIPITKDGKFILTRQKQPASKGFIGALGGRVDPGETFLQAGVRELHEESGITANEWIYLLDYQGHSKIDWDSKTYFVRDLEIGESHIESGEQIELIYCTFDEFIDEVTKEDYRDSEITLEIFQIIKAGKLSSLKNSLLKQVE